MYKVYLEKSIPVYGENYVKDEFDCEEEPQLSNGVIVFKVGDNSVVVPLSNLKCVIVVEVEEDE